VLFEWQLAHTAVNIKSKSCHFVQLMGCSRRLKLAVWSLVVLLQWFLLSCWVAKYAHCYLLTESQKCIQYWLLNQGWEWFIHTSHLVQFSAVWVCLQYLTLLVGLQKGHLACKDISDGCCSGYLSGARCKWSSWCHCHHVISRFTKFQNGTFRYELTQVIQEKRLLNGCLSLLCELTE